jgi:osmoprotectant transport system substrate-binding protein
MRKARMRFSGRALGAMLVGFVLVFAACSSDSGSSGGSSSDEKPALIVGAKDFAGAQIISQAYGQTLENKGYKITFKDNIGPTETVFPLLENGDIDLYGEFSGTFLTFLEGAPTANANPAEVYAAVEDKLADKDIVAVGPASAQDVNAFYVLKKTADKYNLKTVSDLKPVADQLVFGGPAECLDRPLCLGDLEQSLYDLNFKEVKKLDPGGPITNTALDDGTIQVGLLFTGSSVIKDDYVLLTDDKGLQPADNPIALIAKPKATAKVKQIIATVNSKLDRSAYNEMALKVFNDKEDPATVVTQWLTDEGLIK